MEEVTVLEAIEAYEHGDWSPMKHHRWLMYLAMAEEQRVNYEYLDSIEQLQENRLIAYVKRTLEVLQTYELDRHVKEQMEAVLSWSEVAKGGARYQQKQWIHKGINLYAHNEGSAEIYRLYSGSHYDSTVEVFIRTHGLLGQYVRGEVPLSHSKQLRSLIDELGKKSLQRVLYILNHCIIAGVSDVLWEAVREEIQSAIQLLMKDPLPEETIKERMKKLRIKSRMQGENFDSCYSRVSESFDAMGISLSAFLEEWMGDKEIWYFEAALQDFTFEEVVKILLLCQRQITAVKSTVIKHINFEEVMKSMYYDYQGEKKINLYKKRMVEKYLGEVSYQDIREGKQGDQTHLSIKVSINKPIQDTIFIIVAFTKPAINLINFCVEAERAQLGYERAIVLVYDYFGLRKDKYDRFHNEASYLETMNQSIDYKQVILDYIVGNTVMDIGPGGGALMDMIEEHQPTKKVLGVDISSNVIDALSRKKFQENRSWEVRFGDALNLRDDFAPGSVDTIIFCSIIHELYSYIETDGHMFNKKTIKKALQSAFDILPTGGRIIIRDGIMTEPEEQELIIEFSGSDGMQFLKRYANDFKGREIDFELIAQRKVKMSVNDAMEFLYTYTWGEESYAHEINEQFGYFTPSTYETFIKDVLGESANILVSQHYLQEGYTVALEPKVRVFDVEGQSCRLPDSTCLIVIEKR